MLKDLKWDIGIGAAQLAPTPQEPTWRDILLKAAALIDERGLAKGIQQDARSRLCLHGAISIAAYGLPYKSTYGAAKAAEGAVGRYLRSMGVASPLVYLSKDGGAAAAEWNDQPERTKQEVVTALRMAAAI